MSQSLLQRKHFFCREWVFSKISHYLENVSSSKTCGILITGGPGSGKTALCCELVWPTCLQGRQNILNKQLLAYHFCHAGDIETLSISRFIANIVSQLASSSLIVGYNDRIKSPDVEAALQYAECEQNPDEAFKKGVLFPLLEIDPPEQPCFIVVDSVDQSVLSDVNSSDSSHSIGELLAKNHHLFPWWLLLICSSRKQSKEVNQMFVGFRKISLDDLKKSYIVRDVQQYILCRLDQEESLRKYLSKETAEMLNQLHIKSNGCFLYLEKVLDGAAENFIMLREIKDIPGTLNGFYLWLCQRIFNKKQFNKVQAILNVILASGKPLTKEELFQCVKTSNMNLTWEEFVKRLKILSKVLVDGKNGTKIIFHHSFAEWLLDIKHCTQKYLCNVQKGHYMIALRYTIAVPHLSEEDILDFVLHLSKIPITSSLLSQHKTLWLMHCNLPLSLHSKKSLILKDPSVLKLLISAGAKVPSLSFDKAQDLSLPGESFSNSIPGLVDFNLSDNDKQTLLRNACQENNDKLLLQLIEMKVDLDVPDSYGQSAINIAARLGHHHIVDILVKAAADLNHTDNDGWTPLRSAAWAGHTEVVNILLENGAQVDLEDADHRTALRAAAWGGHKEIVSQLLKYGACVNKTDNEGHTALIAAAYMGHTQIVDQLLEHGASINHEDNDGRTALCVAALCVPASEDHAKVVSLLLERGAEVDHADKEGMTPLLVAAFEGYYEVCELLLENEADVDHADHNGRTPLLAAASMGHPSVVKLLLFWGAAVDTIDSEGRTVLSIAAAQGNPDTVSQLLDRGLDEIHRDNSGWTPLHYAAFEGHSEVCELLLDSGANLTEVDNDGRTPLILASQEGHTALVSKLLLHNPGVIDCQTHDGKTSLRIACMEGLKDTVQMLLNCGADINYRDADGRSTLYLLALENHTEMAEFILSKGAAVGAKDLEGRAPLHVSAWQGHLDMVQLLIKMGADVNEVDNDCRTALQSAAWQGHVSVVLFLLEKNATVDHVCNQGATALCIAAQEGHLEVVKVLLEYGADPNHADQFGRSPMRVASKGGHNDVVKLIEEYNSLLRKGEKTKFPVSVSDASLLSTTTAETNPCKAILNQHIFKDQQSSSISPHSSNFKRRSYVSNQSSSKSSSNLTNSTNMSSNAPLAVLSDEKSKFSHKSCKETKQSATSLVTHTQQLKNSAHDFNHVIQPVGDSSSSLSHSETVPDNPSHKRSQLSSLCPDVPIISSETSVEQSVPNELPVLNKCSVASKQSVFSHCQTNSNSVGSKTEELPLRRSGIITNPHTKSGFSVVSKNRSVDKTVNNHVKSIKTNNVCSEKSSSNSNAVKKETHL